MSRMVDQYYLKNKQYQKSDNLNARIQLHTHYSTSTVHWYDWVFDRMEVKPGFRVLEVGCGTGSLWKHVQFRLPDELDCWLLDLSDGMLVTARSQLNYDVRFKYKAADVQNIPFEDQSFDLVIANHMLYHVPDLMKALDEIKRVLRPAGKLVAATNGLSHMRELHKLIQSVQPEYQPGDLSAMIFGLENGEEILQRVFPNVTRLDFPDSLWVTTSQPLLDYIASWNLEEPSPEIFRALANRIQAEISAHGGFRIQKSSGVLFAWQ